MVNCSNCGSGIADDQEFCGQCGAPRPSVEEIANQEQIEDLSEEPIPVPETFEQETVPEETPTAVEAEPYSPPPVYHPPPEKKSSNTCLWIVLSCLIIFLALVCCVIVILAVTMTAFTDTINQMFQTIILSEFI
jgi:uncharacterized membrane protein YvbJ